MMKSIEAAREAIQENYDTDDSIPVRVVHKYLNAIKEEVNSYFYSDLETLQEVQSLIRTIQLSKKEKTNGFGLNYEYVCRLRPDGINELGEAVDNMLTKR